jgi:hypothetical protein
MTIGAGIFLASLALGSNALFGITKDRWSWAKIIGRPALGIKLYEIRWSTDDGDIVFRILRTAAAYCINSPASRRS